MISPALDALLYFLAEQIIEEADREEAGATIVAESREEAQNPRGLTRQ